MATTPKTPPLTTGTTSPASRYTVTPTSTAALGAAQSAIKQATGTAPSKSFTVGSTMSVSKSTGASKFTQGSTTTPAANKAVSSSAPPKNTGTSQSNTFQSILGIAPLATVGLSVFNAVSQGVVITPSVNNVTNTPSTGSTNNVVDPAQRQQAAADVPSTNSTNNVVDPAQRQQAAADVPSTNSTNNVQDPAETARLARQNAEVPSTNSTNNVQDPAETARLARQNAEVPATDATNNVVDPAQRQQAAADVPATDATNNVQDPAETARLARQNAEVPATDATTTSDPSLNNVATTEVVNPLGIELDFSKDPVLSEQEQKAQAAKLANIVAQTGAAVADALVDFTDKFVKVLQDAQNTPDVWNNLSAKEQQDIADSIPVFQKLKEDAIINKQKAIEAINQAHAENPDLVAAYNPALTLDDLAAQGRELLNQTPSTKKALEDYEADQLKQKQVLEEIENAKAKAVDDGKEAPADENVENETPDTIDDGGAADEEVIESPFPEEIPDEESAYPENPIDQKSAEIDELSAYPPGDNQLEDPNNYVENFDNPTDPNYVETFDPAGDPNYIENFDPPPTDEFDGIDAQVDANNYVENFDNPTDPNYIENFDNPTDPNYIENFDPPPTDEFDGIDAQVDANNYVESFDPNLSNRGGLTTEDTARAEQTNQVTQNFEGQQDWRVRLSLAPDANYLYKVGQGQAGILNPLQATEGIIFPYTPAISVVYAASYEPTDLAHTNYRFFSYKNSSVDTITITADFTAQDTAEAQYLLAVIHFFRSVTKMFYGLDENPKNGTPPPLCFLRGLGTFQFNWHPLVINNFTYSLPVEVDYIRVMNTSGRPGVNVGSGKPKGKPGENLMAQRMAGAGLNPGGKAAPPKFVNNGDQQLQNENLVTYVPSKMQITITANPIVSRNNVSNNFSLNDYSTGYIYANGQGTGSFW